ncbi:NADP-dependent oxidoreductase [Bifidobacterium sp. 82T24]|uniref:NADP-dependent oxidoreductase n=1 Tax=Bifidobacterium pluvialisilvae TaxID=2834436 RepID=UPI001C56D7C4|nr:NADP-dependent oxidoreductase [Bifidobacterium pluvialisilvae]MBW3087436.1 NADP-dependent oxidoreductase [Bifidobacterium pluvialisilvae]
MRAAQIGHYEKDTTTAISEVEVHETPLPEAGTGDVLVRVKAAAVNPLEILTITGGVKLIQDYPMPVTLGNELAGVVEQVGSGVSGFEPGDRVYARTPIDRPGALAEYAAVPADALAPMPEGYDFAEAATIPLTGLTAWQAFIEILAVKPGQSVLIPGGSGSFGRMAVPIAKELGLEVVVTGGERAREEILALGADRYLDYRKEDYWRSDIMVDYVIDALGPGEFDRELSVIKPGGALLSLRGVPNKAFAKRMRLPFLKRALFSLAGSKFDGKARSEAKRYDFIFVHADGEQLRRVTDIVKRREVKPSVDPHEFGLDDIREALKLVADGHPSGKVVVRF